MDERTAVCVLGMHRSGTSLITRILNLLGVDLGAEERLLEAGPDNPLGFWEHHEIVQLNEEILALLGGSWHEPPALDPGWERSPALSGLRGAALEVIRREFGRSDLWGWKDPRTCLTLPFWQLLVPGMRYVLCLRNPVDVARSLGRRDGFTVEKAGRLWVDHVERSVRRTAGEDRLILFYEDVMSDWPGALARLSGFLGEHEAAGFEHLRTAVWEVVREDLQHHRSSTLDVVDDPELPDSAKALHLVLRAHVPGAEGSSDVRSEALAALRPAVKTFAASSRSARHAVHAAEAALASPSSSLSLKGSGPDGTVATAVRPDP
ncbi:MAG: sulfotransferase family protein [Actinomycetota bacterium]